MVLNMSGTGYVAPFLRQVITVRSRGMLQAEFARFDVDKVVRHQWYPGSPLCGVFPWPEDMPVQGSLPLYRDG